MSDPVPLAKSARETLAQALAAVQSDPNLPAELSAVAEPVSQAMGALFQIERSQGTGLAQHGPIALDAVRRALALLQTQPSAHKAVDTAMEAVASSLGLVHGLSRLIPVSPPVASAPSWQAAPAPAAPQITPIAQPPAPPAPTTTAEPPLEIPNDIPRVEVALAAHSASNFYKGLTGHDVVEHGGIFVATYSVLDIGEKVALRILFPGGYELDALGQVRWTREPRASLIDASVGVQPGYGATLFGISNEGRALVERYVRNREPLFYDDM